MFVYKNSEDDNNSSNTSIFNGTSKNQTLIRLFESSTEILISVLKEVITTYYNFHSSNKSIAHLAFWILSLFPASSNHGESDDFILLQETKLKSISL